MPSSQPQTLATHWQRFIDLLTAQSPEHLAAIRPPAPLEVLSAAEQRLGGVLPNELRQLYTLADGFASGAYVLRDDYRLLPVDEMVAASLTLVGEPVVLDALAGEVSQPRRVARLVIALARDDNPDVAQVSLRLRPDGRPGSVEIWYRAGGIHDFEEVVNSGESLATWLEECLEYYL
jgi:cell wall assembly regulator SMI1